MNPHDAVTDGLGGIWETPETKARPPIEQNIKKEYRYGRYVTLFSLIDADAGGHRFIVFYEPTGAYFGFKTWEDADAFARGRQGHTKAVHGDMGWSE